MPKQLFSTTEAAEYLGISVPTLKYHLKKGNIKPEMVGNSLVFTEELLDQFKKSKRRPGRPGKDKTQ